MPGPNGIGRVGGDEHTALVPERPDEPDELPRVLARRLAERNLTDGRPLLLDVGLGVAHVTAGESIENLVARDAARYRDEAERDASGRLASRRAVG